MYKIKVTKDTFPQMYKDMLISRNKKNIKQENVKSGNWPLKIDEIELINNDGCILCNACYKIKILGIEKKLGGLYAINGNARENAKTLGAKPLPMKLLISQNKLSLNDLILFGLRLDPQNKY